MKPDTTLDTAPDSQPLADAVQRVRGQILPAVRDKRKVTRGLLDRMKARATDVLSSSGTWTAAGPSSTRG